MNLRSRLLLSATAAVCAALLGAPTAGANAAPAPSAQSSTALSSVSGQKWVRVQHDCAAPTTGRLACLAEHLVPAAAGSMGAKRVNAATYTTGPAGGYTPADLAAAYGFNPSVGGAGQTVAIVDAFDDPHALSDLNHFNLHYGIAAETTTSFRKVNQLGAAVTAGHPQPSYGWAGEISLDIEAVRAVCRKCRILLVEANSDQGADLAASVNMAVKLGATEVSNSYGGPESMADTSFAGAFNHPGVVVTASTGDAGWYDWDNANQTGGSSDDMPNVPAALSTVVAVGGTTLRLNTAGARSSEVVWDGDGPEDLGVASGASGGGCSLRFSAPPWQRTAANYARTGCGTKRQAGDVAAVADPYTGFDVYNTYGTDPTSPWARTGGTSLSSPLVAAMWALAGGAGGVHYPTQSLYENFRYNHTRLYDVVSGGNGFCGGDTLPTCSLVVKNAYQEPSGNPNMLGAGHIDCGFAASGSSYVTNHNQCDAAVGYDGPSGVGAPATSSAFKSSRLIVAIKAPAVRVHLSATFATTLSEPIVGAHATKYVWTWGDTTTTTTTATSAAHVFATIGTYAVGVTVTDSLGRTAHASVAVAVTK